MSSNSKQYQENVEISFSFITKLIKDLLKKKKLNYSTAIHSISYIFFIFILYLLYNMNHKYLIYCRPTYGFLLIQPVFIMLHSLYNHYFNGCEIVHKQTKLFTLIQPFRQ